MARRTFFSFHYQADVTRAQIVRNSWVSKPDRDSAGFFDSSVLESKKRIGTDTLKAFLTEALSGASVTCVLIGSQTHLRPWVRYELVRSFQQGKGLLGIWVNAIKDFQGHSSPDGGLNPFTQLAYQVVGDRVAWKEKRGSAWSDYHEVPSMGLSEVPYAIENRKYHTFSTLFPVYKWFGDGGYNNMGRWIELAARQAGR